MSAAEKPDRGPLLTYEITWKTGHVERVPAHQVTRHGGEMFGFGGREPAPERVRIHAEIDGRWMLILDIAAEDIATIRNVTHAEDKA